jgi:hypothetical protein
MSTATPTSAMLKLLELAAMAEAWSYAVGSRRHNAEALMNKTAFAILALALLVGQWLERLRAQFLR